MKDLAHLGVPLCIEEQVLRLDGAVRDALRVEVPVLLVVWVLYARTAPFNVFAAYLVARCIDSTCGALCCQRHLFLFLYLPAWINFSSSSVKAC
jgi:hypothetical protein